MSVNLNNIGPTTIQQQYTKNMLNSLPPQANKDQVQYQTLSDQMIFSLNHRKVISTNERCNFSSSPVKITNKASEMSPQIPSSSQTNTKFNLIQMNNDTSYIKKILQSPLNNELNNHGYQQIPIGQQRPQNLTQKYIRNFSSFLIEAQKSNQENQYFCSHCKDLLWEPVKCTECPTYYCHSCASKNYTNQNKKCNTCQKLLITISADENICKQLLKISLMCPNNLIGCQAILSYNSYELHQQDCRFKKGRGSENLHKPPLAQDNKKRDSAPVMPSQGFTVTKKEKKDLVSCIHCYKNVSRNTHEQHQNTCPLKMLACQYCKNEVPLTHMKVHEQYRCTKVILCNICNVNVPYGQYNAHTGNCNLYPSTKCSFCDLSYYKSNISEHITACTQNPVNKNKRNVNTSHNQNNERSNKKLLTDIVTQNSANKQQSNMNGQSPTINNITTDLASILSKGIGMQASPIKNGPSTEKLKFMVMDNMFKSQKGRPTDYSFDHDYDQDKTARTKMYTDASMSTEISQNNINIQELKMNALLNTSIQMNTTMPLSPLPPQSKFRAEAQAAAAAAAQNQQNNNMAISQKQNNLIKLHTENPEMYSGGQQNSYKLNNNNISSNYHPQLNGAFMSPQMTSSTRLTQTHKSGNVQMTPGYNTILQQLLNRNHESLGGRSNSLQILQTPGIKTNSSSNLETKS